MKNKIHITEHSGKMENIRSISTNPLTNHFCQAMHDCGNNKVICTKCYATRLVDFRLSLQMHVENNSELLSDRVLALEELPKYGDELIRFNSFGELINHTHVINLFNICYNNPQTYHVIYSKRCDLIEDMIHLKPSNLKIVESNPIINAVYEKPKSAVADLVFNVVTPDYLDANPKYKATCMKNCDKCRLCYSRRTPMKFIVEMLK
jgi:hypothetical protein